MKTKQVILLILTLLAVAGASLIAFYAANLSQEVRESKLMEITISGPDELRVLQHPLSYDTIGTYLRSSTILVSAPRGNYIFVFDDKQGFVQWFANELQVGYWSTTPMIQPYSLQGHIFSSTVQSFCQWYVKSGPELNTDNCAIAYQIINLVQKSQEASVEKVAGDPLQLYTYKTAPFVLPETSPINLSMIQAKIVALKQQNRAVQ